MNESQYINLQVKQWRAITVNWDILAANSLTETKLYCLTDFQAAWLLSMTEYMRWATRWENCPCTQNDLEALKAETDFNLMSCIDFQPYQLQALFDGMNNAQIVQFENDWDGSLPSSVNPDAPDDFFDGDGSADREDALCTALTLWTYSYTAEWLTKAGTVLGIVSTVSSIVDFLIPVGGTIAVRVLADLIAPLQQQYDAMNNTALLDDVICDWRTALEGVAINATNWTNAIQGLSYPLLSDLWRIQQLLSEDTQLLSNFLSFVNALGNGYELAQLGIEICACGCSPVTEFWDFTSSPYSSDWTLRTGVIGQSYVPTMGYKGTIAAGAQIWTDRYSEIYEVTGTVSVAGGVQEIRLQQYESSTNTVGATIAFTPFDGDVSITDQLLITGRSSAGAVDIYLENLTIRGCLK